LEREQAGNIGAFAFSVNANYRKMGWLPTRFWNFSNQTSSCTLHQVAGSGGHAEKLEGGKEIKVNKKIILNAGIPA
jgi:hypothetical protein